MQNLFGGQDFPRDAATKAASTTPNTTESAEVSFEELEAAFTALIRCASVHGNPVNDHGKCRIETTTGMHIDISRITRHPHKSMILRASLEIGSCGSSILFFNYYISQLVYTSFLVLVRVLQISSISQSRGE